LHLPVDPSLQQMYQMNTVESMIQKPTAQYGSKTSRQANHLRKSIEYQRSAMDDRSSQLSRESDNEPRNSRQVTIDTIMRRNNSNTIVKKHAIPYAQLHKKTYFNALEKILISPRHLKYQDMGGEKSIISSANKAFDDCFKRPPSRLGDEAAPVKRE